MMNNNIDTNLNALIRNSQKMFQVANVKMGKMFYMDVEEIFDDIENFVIESTKTILTPEEVKIYKEAMIDSANSLKSRHIKIFNENKRLQKRLSDFLDRMKK